MSETTPPTLFPAQTGSSMIEVLVAVFVLAFGLLGIAGTQASALRNNQGALEHSQVVMLAHSIFESMRSSMRLPTNAEAIDESRPEVRPEYADAGKICSTSPRSSDTLVKNDLTRWMKGVQAALGDDACGQIVCEATDKNLCTVTITWNDSRALGGAESETVSIRSRL